MEEHLQQDQTSKLVKYVEVPSRNETEEGRSILGPLLLVGGVTGAIYLLTRLSKKQQEEKQRKNNEDHGFPANFSQMTEFSTNWLRSGMVTVDDAKTCLAEHDVKLYQTHSWSGYIGVKDRFGLPWISRLNILDEVYEPTSDRGWLRQWTQHTFGSGKYLHLLSLNVPEVYTYNTPIGLFFFSNKKRARFDDRFLTNEVHSWTANKDWLDVIANRGRYNALSTYVKTHAASMEPDFLYKYHPTREMYLLSLRILSNGGYKLPWYGEKFLQTEMRTIFYSDLVSLASSGVLICDHPEELSFNCAQVTPSTGENSDSQGEAVVIQGGKEIGHIESGKFVWLL